MERPHIYERGAHTSVTEIAKPVLDIIRKGIPGAEFSPGKIEVWVGAKSASIKFKHINNHLYQMTVVNKGSKQEFNVFTDATFEDLKMLLKREKRTRDWNVNYIDMRSLAKKEENLDKKYLL